MESCSRRAVFSETAGDAELTMLFPLYLSRILLNQGQGASLGQKATPWPLTLILAKPEMVNFYYLEISKIQNTKVSNNLFLELCI